MACLRRLPSILLVLPALAACTVFNGEEPFPDAGPDGAAAAGGTGGTGGTGAGGPTYLSTAEAAKLCAKVFDCPRLGVAVTASIGVPLSDTSFSACMHWAAGPVADRPGMDIQRKLLGEIASAASCAEAAEIAYFELLDPADPQCDSLGDKATCLDTANHLDCKLRRIAHCASARYTAGSTCQTSGMFSSCANGTCTGISVSCSNYVLSACISGLAIDVDCSTEGFTCGANVCGPGGDVAQGCMDPPGTSTCSTKEGHISVCDGVYVSDFDCGPLKGVCKTEKSTARCGFASDACSPFDADVDKCTGDSIAVCVGGKKGSVDCAAGGLACKPADATHSAHCG